MKPRIALTLSGSTSKRNAVAREQYLDAIRRAGAEPIAIFPNDPLPEEFDGLCLTGGGDIDPARYGADNIASTEIDAARDASELALLGRALARDIPVLGTLFRSAAFQKKETDLAIIVTPRLVRPTRPGDTVRTPLDNTANGNDVDVFLAGQGEVTARQRGLTREHRQVGHILDLSKGAQRAAQ